MQMNIVELALRHDVDLLLEFIEYERPVSLTPNDAIILHRNNVLHEFLYCYVDDWILMLLGLKELRPITYDNSTMKEHVNTMIELGMQFNTSNLDTMPTNIMKSLRPSNLFFTDNTDIRILSQLCQRVNTSLEGRDVTFSTNYFKDKRRYEIVDNIIPILKSNANVIFNNLHANKELIYAQNIIREYVDDFTFSNVIPHNSPIYVIEECIETGMVFKDLILIACVSDGYIPSSLSDHVHLYHPNTLAEIYIRYNKPNTYIKPTSVIRCTIYNDEQVRRVKDIGELVDLSIEDGYLSTLSHESILILEEMKLLPSMMYKFNEYLHILEHTRTHVPKFNGTLSKFKNINSYKRGLVRAFTDTFNYHKFYAEHLSHILPLIPFNTKYAKFLDDRTRHKLDKICMSTTYTDVIISHANLIIDM